LVLAATDGEVPSPDGEAAITRGVAGLFYPFMIVVAYQKRNEQRCVQLAGQISEISDGYWRRNLCCWKEVNMVLIGSTCISFRGVIFYLYNCDIPFCRPLSENSDFLIWDQISPLIDSAPNQLHDFSSPFLVPHYAGNRMNTVLLHVKMPFQILAIQ
jgi:hypothetical protein